MKKIVSFVLAVVVLLTMMPITMAQAIAEEDAFSEQYDITSLATLSTPSSHDATKALVDFSSTAIGVTKGRIRYMTQLTIDTDCYVSDYWKYTLNGTTGTLSSGNKCTSCALSMALSYLGLDYTPGYMSTLYGNSNIPSPFVDIPKLIPEIERVDGGFETLWTKYASDSNHSPVVVYFDYKHPDDGQIHSHAVTIVGKNGGTYYAVDSAANLTKVVDLTFNEDYTKIATSSYARYADTSSIQGFCQWKLIGEPAPKTYTITYDWGDWVDGVVQTIKTDTKTHGVDYTLSDEVPTYGSYVFKGWALDTDLTTPVYQPGDIYTADASVCFYAVWAEPESSTAITLTGTVKDATVDGANYGNPLSGVTVEFFDSTGASIGTAVTNSDGEYTFTFPAPGTYKKVLTKEGYNTVTVETNIIVADTPSLGIATMTEVEKVEERNIIAEGTCGDNLTWTLDDAGLMTIEGTGAMANYSSSTTSWNSYKAKIQSLQMAEGITTIGLYAFADCDYLEKVEIPDSVTTIGNSAFNGCDKLLEVMLGAGVKTLGNDAFSNCTRMTTLTIPDALTTLTEQTSSRGSFRNSPFSIVNVPSTVTSIPANLYNHSTITAFVCEESEYVDENGYFDDNGVLYKYNTYTRAQTLVKCPNSMTIEEYTVLDGTTAIGASAFQSNASLKQVHIPASVTSLGNYAYSGCSNLTAAYFYGNAPTSMGSSVFANVHKDFKIYYINGATGWTNPWNGYTTETFVPEPEAPAQGDLTGDGSIGADDLTLLTDYFTGKSDQSFDPLKADFDHDGAFTRADAMYLARALANWVGYSIH